MLHQKNDLDDHPNDLRRHSSDFQRHSDDFHQKLSQPDLRDGDKHWLQSALSFIEEVALQFGIKSCQVLGVCGQEVGADDFTQAHPVFSAMFTASTDADGCDSSLSCQSGQGEAPSYDEWDTFVKSYMSRTDECSRPQLRRNRSSGNLIGPKSDGQSTMNSGSLSRAHVPVPLRPLPDL